MRRPNKNDFKRSVWIAFKVFAITATILAVAVFTPIWNWSGYPRPSLEAFITQLIILFVVLMPAGFLSTLLKEVSEDRRS
jgi:hypothetical protein